MEGEHYHNSMGGEHYHNSMGGEHYHNSMGGEHDHNSMGGEHYHNSMGGEHYGGPGGREQTLHTCALHVGRFCGYTLTTNTGFGFKQITKGDLRVRTLNNSRHTLQNKRRFACPDIASILTLNKSRHTLQNKTRFLPKTLPVSRSKTLHFSRLIIF